MVAPAVVTDTIAPSSMAARATLVAVPGLRYWRTRRLMTQKELAEAIRAAPTTVARLEAGGDARLATVRKLAEALRVEAPALLDPPPEA
jgi:transcriptional regulator with XRE-family HTH domain